MEVVIASSGSSKPPHAHRKGVVHMTELPALPTVLIIDLDVGFVFWLGEIFTEAGSNAVPALNCGQALSLVTELELQVDVIVLDAALEGVSEMIQALRKENQALKIAVVRSRASNAPSAINADWTLQRPAPWEPLARQDWLRRAQAILHDVRVKGGT
jgi:DNA-binding NtrC family response regulator